MNPYRALAAALALGLALCACGPVDVPPPSGESAGSQAPSLSAPSSAEELPAPEGCRWLTITEAKVLTLINKERKSLGLSPLTVDAELTAAARVRAEELYRGNYVAHTRPNGDPWETVLQKDVPVEFALAAENLAWSNHAQGEDLTAYQWFDMWKESESHYAAMTSERYTHAAAAVLAGPYYEDEEQSYAVTLFCSY